MAKVNWVNRSLKVMILAGGFASMSNYFIILFRHHIENHTNVKYHTLDKIPITQIVELRVIHLLSRYVLCYIVMLLRSAVPVPRLFNNKPV